MVFLRYSIVTVLIMQIINKYKKEKEIFIVFTLVTCVADHAEDQIIMLSFFTWDRSSVDHPIIGGCQWLFDIYCLCS